MSDVENINFSSSIVDAEVDVASLLETVGTSTQAIEDLNHHVQATEAKAHQDYRGDLTVHLSQTLNLLSHEMDGHRTLQQEVASAIEQTLVQQQQSLAQAGEGLAAHCSALLGNLQLASRQSLDNLHQSFE